MMPARLAIHIGAVLTGCIGAGAHAAPDPAPDQAYSAEYRQCMASGDAAMGVTAAMLDCIGAENARQDARLNAAYKRAMARLDPAGKTRLRQSERTWIARRVSHCEKAAASEGGGSMAGLLYADCFLQETARRVEWLEARGG